MTTETKSGKTDRTGMGTLARGLALATALAVTGGLQAAAAQTGGSEAGRQLYGESCAQCHGPSGQGVVGFYPPLDGDPFVTMSEQLPIQVVLEGRAPTPRTPPMPSFGDRLSNQEVADVVSYIRTHWSNDAGPVDAATVAEIRSTLAAGGEEAPGEMPAGWRAEGERIYMDNCAACHQARGEGAEDIFPALAGNPLVTGTDGQYLTHLLLNGRGGMPNFSRSLDDQELASVLSYIRSAWGNDASPVTPQMVDGLSEP